MGEVRKSLPRFRRIEAAPRIELTEDDEAILRLVYRHRFVRAEDIYRYFAPRSPDKLARRLVRLYRSKFLDRPIAQIDRFHEGGSKSLVYGIDNAGARYLKDTLNVPAVLSDWRGRNRSYTRENLDHTLAISHFMIDLELRCKARGDVTVIPFEEILAKAPDATRKSSYPGRWAVPVEWMGTRAVVHIVPDAIFGLRRQSPDGRSRVSYYFLEIDRGTMTVEPSRSVQESEAFLYRATILRKLVAYTASHRDELHKTHFSIGTPRVLTVTTASARANTMGALVHRLAPHLGIPPGLLLFSSAEEGALTACACDFPGTESSRSCG